MAVFAVLTGCCTPWRGPAVILSPSGQRICAKHHVPLLIVGGFEAPADTLVDPNQAWFKIAACFPNHIPEYQALHRDADNPVPVMITYCPICQTELDTRWDKVDNALKKAAAKKSLTNQ
jgi:hypothetical protein